MILLCLHLSLDLDYAVNESITVSFSRELVVLIVNFIESNISSAVRPPKGLSLPSHPDILALTLMISLSFCFTLKDSERQFQLQLSHDQSHRSFAKKMCKLIRKVVLPIDPMW